MKKRRTRAEIVAENDRALRIAAMDQIVDLGWDGVAFTGVAKRAGLTVGAVYGRFENKAEMAIDLWQDSVGPWFEARLADCIKAARAADPEALREALLVWEDESRETTVAVELLVAALFDPDLYDVIGEEVSGFLRGYLSPTRVAPRVTKHEAAAATLVLSFALGRAVTVCADVQPESVSEPRMQVLAGMYSAPPVSKPTPKPAPLHWVEPMDELDPVQKDVLQAAIEVIGTVGYRRATIAKIARKSGQPRGSILWHYPDKAHLVAAAAEHGLNSPGEVWELYAETIEEYGPLLSRAMFLADFFKPSNRHLWAINLELSRSSRLVPELSKFRPSVHILEQTHLGCMLVATFAPDLSRLPFAGPFGAGTAT